MNHVIQPMYPGHPPILLTPPSVLMISTHMNHGITLVRSTASQGAHDVPQMYSPQCI